MASKDKPATHKMNFPKFGRRDRQVKPVEGIDKVQQSNPIASNEIKTVSKQVENKMTERELRRIRKVEEERMKDIDKDNRRAKRRMLRKQVRKDIVQTSSESCATFCFVFIVGSTLLGGGTALIVSGKKYDVFDFIVVGATGIVCGIIFTVTGFYLFIKPLYERHLERKFAGFDPWGEQKGQESSTKPYIDENHANVLKSQIQDEYRQRRRPSNADLYGDEAPFDNVNTMVTPRDESFTSLTKPPFLAVPNNERESFSKKPVHLLDAEEAMSPKKEKRTVKTSSSSNDDIMSNSKVTRFSEKDETNKVGNSQDNNAKQYENDEYQLLKELKTHEDRKNSDDDSSDVNSKDSDYDKILKLVSRNTIVIDYSLMNEMETPTNYTTATPVCAPSDVQPHNSDARNQQRSMENVEAERHSEFTTKLYEKHPDIADKHKKRSKRHKRDSLKSIEHHNTQSEITVPLDDSENEDAESLC